MGSKLYGVGKGRKVRIAKTSASPRAHAAQLRAWGGAHNRGDLNPDFAKVRAWKPKRRRRKLGARRKVTIIQQIMRIIRIPTGRYRRRTRRR